jgi:hypothetical protein
LKDLLVLVPDGQMREAVATILGDRHHSLNIERVDFDAVVHPRRDPGCFVEGTKFIEDLIDDYRHALLMFDAAWEGAPYRSAHELERAVQATMSVDLAAKCAVVVIEPELEVWVWSDSPHVARILRWRTRPTPLRVWLERQGVWPAEAPKPPAPKEALELTCRNTGARRSAAMYKEIAERVSLERCQDPAFIRFLTILRSWFGAR